MLDVTKNDIILYSVVVACRECVSAAASSSSGDESLDGRSAPTTTIANIDSRAIEPRRHLRLLLPLPNSSQTADATRQAALLHIFKHLV